MAKTGTQLITSIRFRLSDATDQAYSTSTLLTYINDGATEFATLTGCLHLTENMTSGGPAASISLSTTTANTFVNIYSVELASSKLDFAPRYEAAKWSPSDTGTPAGWSIWGNTIYLNCQTTLSATNDLDISYTYIPAEMTAEGNECEIPDKYYPALVAYTCFRVHDMNREEGLASRAFAEYDRILLSAAKLNEALLSGGYS
jgi:hypothetical protein